MRLLLLMLVLRRRNCSEDVICETAGWNRSPGASREPLDIIP